MCRHFLLLMVVSQTEQLLKQKAFGIEGFNKLFNVFSLVNLHGWTYYISLMMWVYILWRVSEPRIVVMNGILSVCIYYIHVCMYCTLKLFKQKTIKGSIHFVKCCHDTYIVCNNGCLFLITHSSIFYHCSWIKLQLYKHTAHCRDINKECNALSLFVPIKLLWDEENVVITLAIYTCTQI